jgi:3-oxoacyl-[acyl-carrier-protein] synthase III
MAVPPRVVTNDELATKMETSNEWIVERTGIEQRRWVDPGQGGADLGAEAAKEAIKRAGLEPKDIELIIYATLSPDVMFPGTGVSCSGYSASKRFRVSTSASSARASSTGCRSPTRTSAWAT